MDEGRGGQASADPERSRGAAAAWYGMAALVVGVDQWSKALATAHLDYGGEVGVLPFLSWKLLHNTGAAFSAFAGAGGWQRWVFSAVAVAVAAFMINEIRQLRRGAGWYGFAYACILAGALGNLIDRATLGYVVDFVFVNYDWFRFPVFNVADSAVTVGAGTWILLMAMEALEARRTPV